MENLTVKNIILQAIDKLDRIASPQSTDLKEFLYAYKDGRPKQLSLAFHYILKSAIIAEIEEQEEADSEESEY